MKLRLLTEGKIPRDIAESYIDAFKSACKFEADRVSRRENTDVKVAFHLDTEIPLERLREAEAASLVTIEDWLEHFGKVNFIVKWANFDARGKNIVDPADDWEDEFVSDRQIDVTAKAWIGLTEKSLVGVNREHPYRAYYKLYRTDRPQIFGHHASQQFVARSRMDLYQQLKDHIQHYVIGH